MPFAAAKDGTRLHYEEAGSGVPLLFVHEFGGDHTSWEAQIRYFSRRHRCIVYAARGYTPSDVPPGERFTYEFFRDDIIAVLDHLGIDQAHICGLSMGAYSTLQVGIRYPQRALSLTLAGVGSGSERAFTDEFRRHSRATADMYEKKGARAVADSYGMSPARISFLVKDPRGFAQFLETLARHDAQGSAHTMRNFQGARPSIYDFEDEIRKITLPTLIAVGDEDDPCIEPSLFLKQWIATSGMTMFPKTGHLINLEEPGLFNETLERFLGLAEQGRWPARDPRSLREKPKA